MRMLSLLAAIAPTLTPSSSRVERMPRGYIRAVYPYGPRIANPSTCVKRGPGVPAQFRPKTKNRLQMQKASRKVNR